MRVALYKRKDSNQYGWVVGNTCWLFGRTTIGGVAIVDRIAFLKVWEYKGHFNNFKFK